MRVLRQRGMGKIKPTSNDASISTDLVQRPADIAQSSLAGTQPTDGIGPALAGALIYRSKEPDAGPHVRFCERSGGAIRRTYSTPRRLPTGQTPGSAVFGEGDGGGWILFYPTQEPIGIGTGQVRSDEGFDDFGLEPL